MTALSCIVIKLSKKSPSLLIGIIVLLLWLLITTTIKSLKHYTSTRYNSLASFMKVFSKIISVISFDIVMLNYSSILRLIID